MAAALGAGLVCGLWNGFLVAVLGIQPIVATLILMVAGRGVAQLITEGRIVTFTSPDLIWFGTGSVFGVPAPVVIVAGMLLVTGLVVRGSSLGLLIEATGGNPRGERLVGRRHRRLMIVAVYVWCGLCAALAGIIAAADIMGADANNAGLWLELDAILAVVIGGTSLFGGRFSLVLAVCGALIIQAMNTGILLSGYPPEFNLVVKAAVVLVVLLLQSPRLSGVSRRATCERHGHEARRLPFSSPRWCSWPALRSAPAQFPNFASTRVVANLLTDNAFLGVVATGMTFVIISGGIDLSVGSVIGFSTRVRRPRHRTARDCRRWQRSRSCFCSAPASAPRWAR